MRSLVRLFRKLLSAGGWAPCLVFTVHVTATQLFDVYRLWPQADIPMHFAGGFAIAFFISCCFRALPRDVVRSSRLVVLEAVLIGSLTTSAAVLWEFAEFTLDRMAGTNVQVSLPNTMQDLALGMLGASALIIVRALRVHAGPADVHQVATEWLTGRTA